MTRPTPHQVLQIVVAAFFVSALALAAVFFFVDPERGAPWSFFLFGALCVVCAASFIAPPLYLVKKARLRGRIGGLTVFSAVRQSFWFSLGAVGTWVLFFFHVLSALSLLWWAGVLFFAEMVVRTWVKKRLSFRS